MGDSKESLSFYTVSTDVKKLYKHFKGSMYEVLNDEVTDATNCRMNPEELTINRMVLYRSLDSDALYVRDYHEFFEYLPEHNCYRFEEIKDDTKSTKKKISG